MEIKRNKALIIIYLLFWGFINHGIAQKINTNPITREVIINYSDSTLRFNVLLKNKKQKTCNELYYFWYKSDNIFLNRGGYYGNLLHGKYMHFDKNNKLRCEGYFENGLKNKTWKTWWDNGELATVIQWKNGKRNGKAFYFDQNGILVKRLYFNNDKLHGKILLVRGKTTETIKYKWGNEVKKPAKAPKKKVNTNPLLEKPKISSPLPDSAKISKKSSLFGFLKRNVSKTQNNKSNIKKEEQQKVKNSTKKSQKKSDNPNK